MDFNEEKFEGIADNFAKEFADCLKHHKRKTKINSIATIVSAASSVCLTTYVIKSIHDGKHKHDDVSNSYASW